MIKHEGDKWVLYSHDGKKKLGEHDTKAEAESQEKAINMHKNLRVFAGSSSEYEVREETFDGRPHLVVPVVALVQGVLHAMNSATPELVTAEEFTRPGVVGGFDGRPLFHGHPLVNGEPVSGNSPEVLEAKCIGRVFHAAVKNNKLAVEAWIDVEKCEAVAPDLLERVRAGKTIEVSVGVFCETDDAETGEYEGKRYAGSWRDIVPDHLALLEAGDTGACSVEMGCGVRAAKGAEVSKKDQKVSLVARFMSIFRAQQSPESMSDQDIRRTLGDALRKVDPRAMWPEAVYANAAEPHLVYCVYEGNDLVYFKRNYTMASDGAVSFGDPAEVEPVLSYEPVGAAAEVKAAAGQKDAAEGAPCSCHKGDHKDTRSASDMKREDITKALETATDEQLEAVGKVFEAPAQVETPAAPVETPAVAAAPAAEVKTPTFADILAAASESDREAFNAGKAAGEAKRNELISTIKASGRNTFADAELAAKPTAELENLVKLAGSAKTDFSAAGAARTSEEEATAVPAAPSLTDAVKAARSAK